MKNVAVSILMTLALFAAQPLAAQTQQGTAFSYQGELRQNNAPVTANVDMVFALFDAASNGSQQGPPLQFTAATGNAVAVANGIFTVTLDFGPAFNTVVSDQRWLQVSINGNVLSPRTQIQSAPYALQSRTAEFAYAIQNASVGAAQIVPTQVQARVTGSCAAGSSIRIVAQDGTVTCQTTGGSGTVTSVTTDATLTGGPITTSGTLGIAAGAVGTAQIDNTQVQTRVTGTCSSGEKLLSVNADGTVNCGTDLTGGTGTVTSVGTGPSLSGGPITTSGTIDIAAGGVGLAQINTSQVQARAAGTCALGSYLRGINANGSLVCTPLVASPRLVAIDVGAQPSIAIGSDGYPVISYYNSSGMDLNVAKCADAACNTVKITTVDATTSVGEYSSIAIGSDSFPVVSYWDLRDHLKVAKCRDVACANTPVIRTVDTSNGVGRYTSIAIGADTFPVISYYSSGGQSGVTGLKVCKCKDTSCSVTPQLTTLDTGGGEYTSIAIGTDNNPVVSYFDVTNGHLKVAKCTTPSCGTSTLHTVDSSASVGEYTSVAIGSDTFPVISYADFGTGNLKVAKCTDVSCSAAASIHVVDAVSGAQDTSIRIGSNGFPVIAYFDSHIGNLKVASCANAACTGEVTSTVDSAATSYATLAIGGDTLPVLAYNGGNQLRVAKCNNATCQ